jgi:hypothetical protein
MKPYPLNAIDALADGQPIACIQATVKKLWPRKAGTNSQGEWSIQNGTLRDPVTGAEVAVQIKERPDMMHLEGKAVVMTAKSDKGKMTGLYAIDNKVGDKPAVRTIKVTPSCQIEHAGAPMAEQQATERFVDAAPGGWDEQGNLPQTQTLAEFQANGPALNPPPVERQPGPTPQRQHPPAEIDLETRQTIVQIANLHLTCLLAVCRFEAPAYKAATGVDMSEGQMQAAAASIFIKADKLGLHSRMPVSPIKPPPAK